MPAEARLLAILPATIPAESHISLLGGHRGRDWTAARAQLSRQRISAVRGDVLPFLWLYKIHQIHVQVKNFFADNGIFLYFFRLFSR
jgi:hypothetical protein